MLTPAEHLDAARRHEMTGAWAAVGAAAFLAALPADEFLRMMQLLVIAPCLIASFLLVNNRSHRVALVVGTSIVFLVWVIVADLIYEFA
jgi:hypothetical protein